MTGIGITELLENISVMIPQNDCNDDRNTPLSGIVFKIERESTGEKIAYVRIFSGCLHVRKYVDINRKQSDLKTLSHKEKIKKLHIFHNGNAVQSPIAGMGEFCKVWGLSDIRIGDVIGEWSDKMKDIHFAEPQMEAAIEARPKEKNHDLYQALVELSEEDP